MGRATQGVRLINLERHSDEIASVCKVTSEKEEELEIEDQDNSDEEEFSTNQNEQTADEN
jgi:DNA gyrase subunit A